MNLQGGNSTHSPASQLNPSLRSAMCMRHLFISHMNWRCDRAPKGTFLNQMLKKNCFSLKHNCMKNSKCQKLKTTFFPEFTQSSCKRSRIVLRDSWVNNPNLLITNNLKTTTRRRPPQKESLSSLPPRPSSQNCNKRQRHWLAVCKAKGSSRVLLRSPWVLGNIISRQKVWIKPL